MYMSAIGGEESHPERLKHFNPITLFTYNARISRLNVTIESHLCGTV